MSGNHQIDPIQRQARAERFHALTAILFALNCCIAIGLVFVAEGVMVGPSWLKGASIVGIILVQQVLLVLLLSPVRRLEEQIDRYWTTLQPTLGMEEQTDAFGSSPELRLRAMLQALHRSASHSKRVATSLMEQGVLDSVRTARQLFDSTAQQVAGLLLEISAATSADVASGPKNLEGLRHIASQVLGEITTMAGQLYSMELDKQGLGPALKQLGRIYSRGNGIEIDVETRETEGPLDIVRKTMIFRVAEEALRNATRHAAPRHIAMKLSVLGSTYLLEIRDDGRGFDVGPIADRQHGTGLTRILDEINLVGGQLELRSAPGNGTSLVATIPFAAVAELPERATYGFLSGSATL